MTLLIIPLTQHIEWMKEGVGNYKNSKLKIYYLVETWAKYKKTIFLMMDERKYLKKYIKHEIEKIHKFETYWKRDIIFKKPLSFFLVFSLGE